MDIRPFGVEMWMNAYETKCQYNLAETCVASVSLAELLALSGRNDSDLSELLGRKMTYGAIEGLERLRRAIAALYTDQTVANIVTTHGTIGANALVYKTLISAGDHMISICPSYQQHDAIPESLGAEVTRLDLREADGWLPDMEALRALIRSETRLISLTNPNNPTGALLGRAQLDALVEIARSAGSYILCDEVYRGTAQEEDALSPSIADLYEKGIATASMSKAFSLAGLRVGWITAPQEVIEQVMIHRDYDTISVSQIDEYFATLALEAAPALLARSRAITRKNLALVDAWVSSEPRVSYVKPSAATICLLRYGMDMGSHALCEALLAETGVLLTPGSAFDMEGYLRLGFGNPTETLEAGLPRISNFLRQFDRE